MLDIQRQRLKHLLANAILELWKKETGSMGSVVIEGTVCITASSGRTTVVQVADKFTGVVPDGDEQDEDQHNKSFGRETSYQKVPCTPQLRSPSYHPHVPRLDLYSGRTMSAFGSCSSEFSPDPFATPTSRDRSLSGSGDFSSSPALAGHHARRPAVTSQQSLDLSSSSSRLKRKSEASEEDSGTEDGEHAPVKRAGDRTSSSGSGYGGGSANHASHEASDLSSSGVSSLGSGATNSNLNLSLSHLKSPSASQRSRRESGIEESPIRESGIGGSTPRRGSGIVEDANTPRSPTTPIAYRSPVITSTPKTQDKPPVFTSASEAPSAVTGLTSDGAGRVANQPRRETSDDLFEGSRREWDERDARRESDARRERDERRERDADSSGDEEVDVENSSVHDGGDVSESDSQSLRRSTGAEDLEHQGGLDPDQDQSSADRESPADQDSPRGLDLSRRDTDLALSPPQSYTAQVRDVIRQRLLANRNGGVPASGSVREEGSARAAASEEVGVHGRPLRSLSASGTASSATSSVTIDTSVSYPHVGSLGAGSPYAGESSKDARDDHLVMPGPASWPVAGRDLQSKPPLPARSAASPQGDKPFMGAPQFGGGGLMLGLPGSPPFFTHLFPGGLPAGFPVRPGLPLPPGTSLPDILGMGKQPLASPQGYNHTGTLDTDDSRSILTQSSGRSTPEVMTDINGNSEKDATSNGDQKVYRCEYCNKTFLFKSKYHEHLPVHTNARPFECHLCSRTYKYKYDLRVHLRTHLGIPTKSTICPFCSRKFHTNKILRLHIQESHRERQQAVEEEPGVATEATQATPVA